MQGVNDKQSSIEPNIEPTERMMSITAGALLILAGLFRSASATTVTLLGCALALRGATGQCALYRSFGINRAKRRSDQVHLDACVDTALDDSFPASDPPAWVGGRE